MTRVLLSLAFLILATLAPSALAQGAPPRLAAGGMVAADHPVAAQIGANVLRRGGNAVDAAVATSFALSICRPYSCGIGGGGFMVIWLADDRRAVMIDYRETAPAAVGPDFFADRPEGASERGGAAIAVPGTVAGLVEAQRRYGRLYLFEVLSEVVLLGEQGFAVDEHYERTARAMAERFEQNPEWKRLYPYVWTQLLREGRVAVGDVIRNPAQAELIRRIGQRGESAFYGTEVSADIAAAVQAAGGVMTAEDVQRYTGAIAEPLHVRVGDLDVWTMPPPSSGGVALAQTLSIMERLRARGLWERAGDPAWAHALAESFRHAFADRAAFMGDPRFTEVPLDHLLAPATLDALAARVRPDAAMPAGETGSGPAAPAPPEDAGTSHISVVDRAGNAVACTETINLEFGSLVAVDRWGFVLNNEMDDFTARPGEPNAFGLVQSARNAPEAGKRPLSSMTPTIVTREGRVQFVVGASGGPRIITGVAQVLHRLMAGETVEQAVAAPRLHHQWMPEVLYLESPLDADAALVEALESRGHAVERLGGGSAVQAIAARERMGWTGAADPRKGGAAIGVEPGEIAEVPARPQRRSGNRR